MNYGICNLSNIPLRKEPDHKSEMISELLFGDHFKVIDTKKNWVKIKIHYDGFEGWVEKLQYIDINEKYYTALSEKSIILTNNLIDYIEDKDAYLFPIILGSRLPSFKDKTFIIDNKKYSYDGRISKNKYPKENIVKIAFMYLNSPYLWGGKTPFGIDCSGYTQMVYKINGYKLYRDVTKQATQGEVLSFIEESEPGDLAFFDDDEGTINHVGIMLANNYIIHASGKVRIDRLDQSGIYNNDLKKHTHKLRVIKKIF